MNHWDNKLIIETENKSLRRKTTHWDKKWIKLRWKMNHWDGKWITENISLRRKINYWHGKLIVEKETNIEKVVSTWKKLKNSSEEVLSPNIILGTAGIGATITISSRRGGWGERIKSFYHPLGKISSPGILYMNMLKPWQARRVGGVEDVWSNLVF